jgi:hypothetical protein
VARVGPYELRSCLRRDALSEAHVAVRRGHAVRLTLVRPAARERAELRGYLARGARLSDPRILQVLDYGLVRDRVYVVTALPEGSPLHVWRPRRTWPEVQAVLLAAGEALAAALAAGVVHYGLTPDDITIDPDGPHLDLTRARLDWTVGRNDCDSFSLIGDPRGTAWYEDPDLWCGHPRTEASSLYSLCAVAWRVLAGAPAYTGATEFDRAQAVFADRIQPPPAGTDVPPAVWTHLARGLHRRPEDRWPSLEALLAALADP